ncbi:MAG: hypothetical protein EOO90_22080 [Pedobacter sp.]|nr:MAG: hypothetical protein EOO90_22080 [Pedobacter sp.]
MINRVWNSPTIMTWMSYSTKTLSLFVVLPMVLNRFTSGDVVLWYLFFTIISLQSIADFGFRQTFSRLISYAFGGATDIAVFNTGKKNHTDNHSDAPNKSLLNDIISNMKFIYIWLTLALFCLMAVFGTWSMIKPINESSNQQQSWLAWIIVLVITCISFYGKVYMNFLEGLFKIALVRRIEVFTSLGSILSSILVMLISPTLLNMVIVNQLWVLVVVVRDWHLCRTIDNGFYKLVSKKLQFDKLIFMKIWQPAWRSGISGLMSVGLTNLTGLIYAQVGATNDVAAYLLALRVINQIKEISMAPFYSKLPLLAMLRVKNDLSTLVTIVRKSMFLSHLVYAVGFITAGLLFDSILSFLKSDVHFLPQSLWIMIGFAYFIHRFGAMHIQVYLSTNHIISHIADGISGILYIVSGLILARYIGVYAIPVGMLVGYLGFYAWYACMYSYRSMGVSFWKFEFKASFIPILLMLAYIAYEMLI